eukprot:1780395-Prymnesium_polylepis.1
MGTRPQRQLVPIAGAEPHLCDAIQQSGPSRWGIRASARMLILLFSYPDINNGGDLKVSMSISQRGISANDTLIRSFSSFAALCVKNSVFLALPVS